MTNYPVTPRIGGATHGDLAKQGVVAIVHAPTGAMSECGGIYEPTPESVAASIDNGFLLLLANGFNRMAVRFIGGNIFLERIGTTKETLAETIVTVCLTNYGQYTVIVANNAPDKELFQGILKNSWPAFRPEDVVKQCGILDFEVHQASVIMNAANMEVQFGGGISGIIGDATSDPGFIDKEAQQAIEQFWASQSSPVSVIER